MQFHCLASRFCSMLIRSIAFPVRTGPQRIGPLPSDAVAVQLHAIPLRLLARRRSSFSTLRLSWLILCASHCLCAMPMHAYAIWFLFRATRFCALPARFYSFRCLSVARSVQIRPLPLPCSAFCAVQCQGLSGLSGSLPMLFHALPEHPALTNASLCPCHSYHSWALPSQFRATPLPFMSGHFSADAVRPLANPLPFSACVCNAIASPSALYHATAFHFRSLPCLAAASPFASLPCRFLAVQRIPLLCPRVSTPCWSVAVPFCSVPGPAMPLHFGSVQCPRREGRITPPAPPAPRR